MTDRIIDVSAEPARLRVKYDQLVIKRDDKPDATAPLCEIAALVVSNPQVSYSHAVLAGLADNGAALIVCDSKHMPTGMMMPMAGNYVQAERFALQAAAKEPTKKRLWQQVVKAKVGAQARALTDLTGKDPGLMEMAKRVRSGDADNIEAQASRRYWPTIFGDKTFRRDRDKKDQNRNLNYGYAVLRAIIARAICAAGLHPSLGLFHHNRYDAFCLADDLMEPYRPLVDRAVAKWVDEHGPEAEFEQQAKAALITPLTGRFDVEGEQRSLFDAATRMANSLARVFEGKKKLLTIPDI